MALFAKRWWQAKQLDDVRCARGLYFTLQVAARVDKIDSELDRMATGTVEATPTFGGFKQGMRVVARTNRS